MRRLVALAVGTVLAACLAAWAAAATVSPSSSSRPEAGSATLPPLPADIKARGRLNVAVKCDSPPFGSMLKGRKVGVDVDIAQQLALLAFGKKNGVTLTCVTTPEREAALTSGSADLVIATFSYTPDRDTRIDFSRAYYKATGRLLVSRGSAVQSLADIGGKRVATTSGSIYDRWLEKCFPTAKRITATKFTSAVQQWRTKKADVLMWDDPSLVNIASQRPERGDPQGHVPPVAVRDRDQAGERRAQGLGQLTARAASPAGRVLHDPRQALPAAPVRVVPEQRPSAEEHVRVREGDRRGVSLAA